MFDAFLGQPSTDKRAGTSGTGTQGCRALRIAVGRGVSGAFFGVDECSGLLGMCAKDRMVRAPMDGIKWGDFVFDYLSLPYFLLPMCFLGFHGLIHLSHSRSSMT
ncbi:hypothetical protein BDZ89DRAFT_89233 [Hymenopellis radicata]|nr:hypothetical protein BDZ89DRAFT_89233 [Hymenopellis radicata]